MSAPFIDDTGFNELGLNGWLALIQGDFQSTYGSDIDVGPDSPDGQLIGTLAGRFSDLEQLLQTIYNGRSPAGAVGAGLSRLIRLNGITRKSAQVSSVPVTILGTPGTVITAGFLMGSNVDPTKPPFQLTGTQTIGGGGTVSAVASCTAAGPVTLNNAPAELTVILTPVAGVASVSNTSAAAPGSAVEADPAVRIRREVSVAMPSQSLLDGLEAALQNLAGVTNARVYENDTSATDANGLPAHSINAIVVGGASADIGNAIWTKASMGVTKVGAQSFTVTDTQGNPQTQNWDMATDVDVYITIKLNGTPTNLAYIQSQVQNAVVAYYSPTGDLPIDIGENVCWADILTPVNALALTGRPGLPSITNVFLGSTASPVLQADLAVLYKQIAVFDVSRILVTGP